MFLQKQWQVKTKHQNAFTEYLLVKDPGCKCTEEKQKQALILGYEVSFFKLGPGPRLKSKS